MNLSCARLRRKNRAEKGDWGRRVYARCSSTPRRGNHSGEKRGFSSLLSGRVPQGGDHGVEEDLLVSKGKFLEGKKISPTITGERKGRGGKGEAVQAHPNCGQKVIGEKRSAFFCF